MELMLGSDVIPYQMEIFPGNKSEKPDLPRALERIREEKGNKPKIIQVADKGLNCAENIGRCGSNDGYIFSKSLGRCQGRSWNGCSTTKAEWTSPTETGRSSTATRA